MCKGVDGKERIDNVVDCPGQSVWPFENNLKGTQYKREGGSYIEIDSLLSMSSVATFTGI